jgi:hypothetical protein
MDQRTVTPRRFLAAFMAAAIIALLDANGAVAGDPAPIKLDPAADPAEFCRAVQAAFTREDFGALEATAERARALTTHFPGGKAELEVFYDSFSKESCTQYYDSLSETAGKSRVALVERWLGEKPDSLTARIASAIVWEQFSWTSRGNGYANTVSQAQWAVFSDRVKTAAQFMRNVDPTRDAHAYLVLLDLARDFNLPRPQIDTVFRQAHDRFPTYLAYYTTYAVLILPKWFGAPGDMADYTHSLLGDPGGDDGAMAYSRVAERLSWEADIADIYRYAGLNWADVQRGFALRESKYGLDKYAWISLCYFAALAGDRGAAREAFRHVSRLEDWPKGGRHDFYLYVLPWIMQRD